jgi:NAD(P)-dependent dehydrogenase (short-subunit alcohol dehydrogenase family)
MSSKVVIITGAGGALGSAVAAHLVATGYRAALVDGPHGAARQRALVASLGDACIGIEADVAESAAGASPLKEVEGRLGPPTHAVLIAGAWQGQGPLHAQGDDREWRAMMTANLETAYASLHALLPGMVARKSGSVVVIGSRVAERPWTSAGAAAYGVSKAAVVALAEIVAEEVREHGVRVNAVLPSTLDTPANRKAMPAADPARWVTTSSAAEVIAFLLSDGARDVSGAALPLYGRS